MTILQIEHAVRDFDGWKAAFDSDPIGREQGGVRRYRVLRPVDDPNYALIELEFDSAGEAEAFREKLEELWGRVQVHGMVERPQARIVEEVERKDY
jgi:hypothetical protein